MAQRAFTDKLLDLAEYRANEIAEHWYKSISTNPKTPSYHSLPKEVCILQAVTFYKNLKRLYFSTNPQQEILRLLEETQFVEAIYANGIVLHEAVYAVIMIRRHLWLYAELQALFVTSADMYQAVESINRTILLFDYAVYTLTKKYHGISRKTLF